jgi:hypothetical protein
MYTPATQFLEQDANRLTLEPAATWLWRIRPAAGHLVQLGQRSPANLRQSFEV